MAHGILSRASLLLLLVILSSGVHAATLSGTVYDYTLTPVDGAIVSVNTTPRQQYVTRNQSYEFLVPQGSYLLSAKLYLGNTLVASSEESINVSDSGTYALDLILFPNLEDSEPLYYDLEFNFSDDELTLPVPQEKSSPSWYMPWLLALGALTVLFGIVIATMVFFRRRIERTHDDEDDTTALVLALIRRHRRITQKEIRKEVPVSEAKISLVLAELEENGVIRKIKKGRGNIIVLK